MNPSDSESTLPAALEYLGMGFWPVPQIGKFAPEKGWHLKPRPTEGDLRDAWSREPRGGYDLGLRLGPEGNLIDIDVDDPEQGELSLKRLFGDQKGRWKAPKYKTNRGYHLLFAWDDRLESVTSIKGLWQRVEGYPGLEFRLGGRGKGMTATVPPSRNADGARREWLMPIYAALMPLPDETIDRLIEDLTAAAAQARPTATLRPARPVEQAPDWEERKAQALHWLSSARNAVTQDGGHDQTFGVACRLKGFAADRDELLELLEIYNADCEPAWNQKDLEHKADDAIRFAKEDWLSRVNRPRPAAEPKPKAQPALTPKQTLTSPDVEIGVPSQGQGGATPSPEGAPRVLDWSHPFRTFAPAPPPRRERTISPETVELSAGATIDDPAMMACKVFDSEFRRPSVTAGGKATDRTLLHRDGEWFHWDERTARWRFVSKEKVKAIAARRAQLDIAADRVTMPIGEDGDEAREPLTARRVNDLMSHLSHLALCDESEQAPIWIGAHARGWDAFDVFPTRSGLIHLPTFAAGQGDPILPPTPAYFSEVQAPWVFSGFPIPWTWLGFLKQVLGDDAQAVQLLQEWFGYSCTLDTRQEKCLFIIGPTRCGKGTIVETLKNMLGEDMARNIGINDFADGFSLEGLIDKRAVIIPDGRLSPKKDFATVLEKLLSLTSGESLSINRKNRSYLNTRLPGKVTLCANLLPKFGDCAGAIAARALMLDMQTSFAGREDKTLKNRIEREIPGIFAWAMEGLARLTARGDFIQPDSGKKLIYELEITNSPIKAFVEDCCELGPHCEIEKEAFCEAYRAWIQKNKIIATQDSRWIGRLLLTSFDKDKKIKTARYRRIELKDEAEESGAEIAGDSRHRYYRGIRLREEGKAHVPF